MDFTVLRNKHQPADQRSTGPSLQPAARAGLTTVYQQIGLPEAMIPEQFPRGERRMLADRELTEFVTQLYQPSESSKTKLKGKTKLR